MDGLVPADPADGGRGLCFAGAGTGRGAGAGADVPASALNVGAPGRLLKFGGDMAIADIADGLMPVGVNPALAACAAAAPSAVANGLPGAAEPPAAVAAARREPSCAAAAAEAAAAAAASAAFACGDDARPPTGIGQLAGSRNADAAGAEPNAMGGVVPVGSTNAEVWGACGDTTGMCCVVVVVAAFVPGAVKADEPPTDVLSAVCGGGCGAKDVPSDIPIVKLLAAMAFSAVSSAGVCGASAKLLDVVVVVVVVGVVPRTDDGKVVSGSELGAATICCLGNAADSVDIGRDGLIPTGSVVANAPTDGADPTSGCVGTVMVDPPVACVCCEMAAASVFCCCWTWLNPPPPPPGAC